MLLDFWSGRRGNDSHRPSEGRNPRFSQQKFRNVDLSKRGYHEFLRFKNLHFPLIPALPHRTPCARPWIRNEEVLPLMAIEKWRSQAFGVQGWSLQNSGNRVVLWLRTQAVKFLLFRMQKWDFAQDWIKSLLFALALVDAWNELMSQLVEISEKTIHEISWSV